MITEDMKRTISELEQESSLPSVGVELVDNELATLYMNSKKSEVRGQQGAGRPGKAASRVTRRSGPPPPLSPAQADFRDYPPLLRQAVSIARKIQDPLVEYAQVCSSDEDIVCLKLHPLQVRPAPVWGGGGFGLERAASPAPKCFLGVNRNPRNLARVGEVLQLR